MIAGLRRIVAIVRKETLHLLRDRLSFGMVFGMPVMQLLLFGYAINQDVRHLSAGVADLSDTDRSRRLVADAEASQVVDLVSSAQSAEGLEDLLRRGEIAVGIFIPHDFERRVERGKRATAQLLVDGSDPIILSSAQLLAELPVSRKAPRTRAPPTFEVRAYYNPERRSPVQIIPGLIGVILTMTMTLFTAVAIVRERERGNLELLITTPIRTVELMSGKIIPYILVGMLQVTLVLAIGATLFDVPVRGDLGQVYAAALIFVTATLGLGLLISTVARTQFQAFQLTFFTFLPQILLSGFMFPREAMPEPARWIGAALPLTWFLEVLRGILLKGLPWQALVEDTAVLTAFAVLFLVLSVRRFHKTLE